MNKPRALRTVIALAVVVAAIAMLYHLDLLGLLRRMHGMAWHGMA